MTNWMIDTMVSMTLLMALVLMIRKPVSRFFGPHIAYLLWALPLARLFMPTLTLKAAAPVLGSEAAATPILSGIANVSGALSGQNMAGLHIAEQSAVMSALASIDWTVVALAIWLGGAGLLFISKLASYFQFREDIISDGHLVGQHGRIKILETAAVGGPLAFGLFDKYIAVPTNFFRDFAPRERELALEHEIAHHESGDLAANFVGLLVLSLHWFNPVAWAAWAAFRQDQETACDARVLQKGLENGSRDLRAVYGRTIAKSVSGHQLGLASPLNQKNKIKDRLKMLGQSEKSVLRKRMGALMVGASTVVALPLTATVTYAVETQAQPIEVAEAYLPVKAHAENTEIAAIQQPAALKPPLAKNVPPAPPAPPLAPLAPAAPIFSADEIPDREEVHNIVEEATQQAHYDVKETLKAAEMARQKARLEAKHELRVALANARREMHEAQLNAREIQREAMEVAREARQDALQERGLVARVWEMTQITIKPHFNSAISATKSADSNSTAKCTTTSRKIALAGANAAIWTYVETNIAGCPETDQPEAGQKAILTVALDSLDNKRATAAQCSETDGPQKVMVKV